MVASLWPTTNLCGHFWCLFLMQTSQLLKVTLDYSQSSFLIQPACEARQRTYALRALRLLLADSAPTMCTLFSILFHTTEQAQTS